MLIHPVILSGGSGTRLWPVSRPDLPKQFIALVTQQTLLQETILRAAGQQRFAAPIFVTNARYGALIKSQSDAIAQKPAAILLEPRGRNTAAAIAIAAHWITDRQGDDLMLVMPSDHQIKDLPAFHQAIERAMPAAMAGRLVTFGIEPHRPETGYGYIECGAGLVDAEGVFSVSRFAEKPDAELAATYLASGRHLWNAGIFLFKASAYLAELGAHAPGVARHCAAAMQAATFDGSFATPQVEQFEQCPDISIDYAVMEKTERAAVVPVAMGWSDIGSWEALWEVQQRDENDNAHTGAVTSIDSHGNLIYVDGGPPVATAGLKDMIVVSTADGVLIIPRQRSQDVKLLAQTIKSGD
ncbi:mannose-1-phosphate guanylyltransferase/mannose-6-phosphate isomerase [Sphingobium sp. Z007]|uniref:mannose-1-phosphate guanylyltransferase/mannose-6-phosphate isomerase n=1 Tax=Sphingobium sp. Z007 TaxID=627495 RepID=UPI000B497594|nr:mannose-1-phosphate guanylyltransferase/mannose-6-phosphate isomerase [Sphingobium sp. Z007]